MKEQQLRDRVCGFWSIHRDKGQNLTVKHFVDEGFARSTIYSLFKKLKMNQDVSRQPGSGSHNKKLTNAQRGGMDSQ